MKILYKIQAASGISLLLLYYSCGSNIKINGDGEHSYKTIAEEKFKSGYNFIFNSDSSFVICEKQINPDPLHPQKSMNFFIYNNHTDNIIYEESVPDGSIAWMNDHLVKIVNKSGVVSRGKNDTNIKVQLFDVKQNKILPFNTDIQELDKN